jgi:hypothetical protein
MREVVEREAGLLGRDAAALGDRLLDPRLLCLERVDPDGEDPAADVEVVDPAAVRVGEVLAQRAERHPLALQHIVWSDPCLQDAIARSGC